MLRALETDNRQEFPAEVYVKAFYKKYAEYLGLDQEEILAAYQPQADLQKNSRKRFNIGTGITLKDRDESLISEIAGRLLVPVMIILGGGLLYWIYVNYLAPN